VTVYDDDEGPLNFNTGTLAGSVVVPGRVVVYGFTVYNTSAAAEFVCVFDANAVPATGAVPLFSWPLAAHNGAGFDWTPRGRQFQTGLVLAGSSTDATLTATEAVYFFDVQWDVYPQQNAPGTGE
jgi:hypothetical protein